MTQEQLGKYAEIVLFGAGDVAGRRVSLHFEDPGRDLALAVADLAYRRGAVLVDYHYRHPLFGRSRLLHAPGESLDIVTDAFHARVKEISGDEWTHVNIRGSEWPDADEGLDPERLKTVAGARMTATKPLMARTATFQVPWIIVMPPSRALAVKAFPDREPHEALKLYEQAMIRVLHLDDADPAAFWAAEFDRLRGRRERLDALNLEGLHFSGPGTDLYVGLHAGGRWATAEALLPSGALNRVNIPSCEVFTTPDCRRTEGRVAITKPFPPVRSGGGIVEGAWFTFREGRVVDAGAAKNAEALGPLLDLDDRARFLGEIALVDQDSPVAREGFLFSNVLYDENASCHLAVGGGFPSLVEGGTDRDEAGRIEAGINVSLQHQDMMIGSDEGDLDGVGRDGNRIPLMRGGRFVDF